MKEVTDKELEALCKKFGYSPEEIGIAILGRAGYLVEVVLKGNEPPTVTVTNRGGEVLYEQTGEQLNHRLLK